MSDVAFKAEFFGGPFNGILADYSKIGDKHDVVPSEIKIRSQVEGFAEKNTPTRLYTQTSTYVKSSIQPLYTYVRYEYVGQVTEGEIAQTHAESNRS